MKKTNKLAARSIALAITGLAMTCCLATASMAQEYVYVGDYLSHDVLRFNASNGSAAGSGAASSAVYLSNSNFSSGVEGVNLNTENVTATITVSGQVALFNSSQGLINTFTATGSNGVDANFTQCGCDLYVTTGQSGNSIEEFSTSSALTQSNPTPVASLSIPDPREIDVLSNGDVLLSAGADGHKAAGTLNPEANVYLVTSNLSSDTEVVTYNEAGVPTADQLNAESGVAEIDGTGAYSNDMFIFVSSSGYAGYGAGPDLINEYVYNTATGVSTYLTTLSNTDEALNNTGLPNGIFGLQVYNGNLYVGALTGDVIDQIDLGFDSSLDGGLGGYDFDSVNSFITGNSTNGMQSTKYFSFSDDDGTTAIPSSICPEPSAPLVLSVGMIGIVGLLMVRRQRRLN